MKGFWLVLLSLGLVMAFSASAFALDVKFSGSYYVGGMYLDKNQLMKNSLSTSSSGAGPTSFFYQSLRVKTEFVFDPGLSLITRATIMERAWGANRSSPGTTLLADSAGTNAENQNIAFDWVYIYYNSPIGIFSVGYMNDNSTGTIFGNSYAPAARIKYSYPIGPLTLNVAYTKVKDDYIATTLSDPYADADNDKYGIEAVYTWKSGLAGLNINYYRYANTRPAAIPPALPATGNYNRTYYVFTPYAIIKLGPVDLQTEFNYATGKYAQYDAGVSSDVQLENYSGWIDATATFGPVYFGATVAYVSGDDPNTTDKNEGGILTGGRDWNPTLIMYNYDREMWLGELASPATTGNGFGTSGLTNGWLYQGRIGYRPTDKWDIMASLTYANVDKRPANYVGGSYGTELDITATYKITNNLTYMFGVGYLWTGDYFKGTALTNEVCDDYMVINKLTLTF